jgi:hypothetical protein
VHLPTPGLFTTDPGITRRTPVSMARCSIEACFGFDGRPIKPRLLLDCLRTNNRKLPGPPRRHRLNLAKHGNGPMLATFSTHPSISDRTPRATLGIDHQLGTGAELPPLSGEVRRSSVWTQ